MHVHLSKHHVFSDRQNIIQTSYHSFHYKTPHIKQVKLVINQLNKLGHSASYTELQRFETTVALTELTHASQNDIIIPMNTYI